ncbi:hypothetical protein BH20ACI1_BH20ACI1_18500 [soil metagenome]
MKAKTYLFRFAVAFTAFVCGVGFFGVGRYFQKTFAAKEQKVELAAPAPIIVEQAETPVIEKTDVADDSEENAKYEFEVGGFYSIIGELPKGFEDFEEISVTIMDYENASEETDYEGISIPPKGYLLQAEKEFNFTRISLTNKLMAFETQTVKGISYKFSGKFLEKAPFWNFDSETPVLEGHLVKFKKGKKAAESNVRLQWYGGGCGC